MSNDTSTTIRDATPGGSPGLTAVQKRRVLSVDRRRVILTALTDASFPVSLETLAEDVNAATETTDVEHCATALHHRHLPLLEEAGLVEYEPCTNTVESCHGSVAALVD